MGAIYGSKSGPKRDPKSNQKWDKFGNRFLRLSGFRDSPKREINETGEKGQGCWKYTQKKKGRDTALKGLIRPSRA